MILTYDERTGKLLSCSHAATVAIADDALPADFSVVGMRKYVVIDGALVVRPDWVEPAVEVTDQSPDDL